MAIDSMFRDRNTHPADIIAALVTKCTHCARARELADQLNDELGSESNVGGEIHVACGSVEIECLYCQGAHEVLTPAGNRLQEMLTGDLAKKIARLEKILCEVNEQVCHKHGLDMSIPF